jgi:hyperosmotically inducible periplasmic protein
MLRALFKLILLTVIVVGVAGFLLGWWSGRDVLPDSVAGTAGKIDTERARQIGAQVGEKTAAAAGKVAEEAKEALGDGALTTKIKAKMALDDSVKALNLNVDTSNGIVTVSGKVRSAAERERALQLARETNGVRQVVDRITFEGK